MDAAGKIAKTVLKIKKNNFLKKHSILFLISALLFLGSKKIL